MREHTLYVSDGEEEKLKFNDFTGRSITVGIKDSYAPSKELILGLRNSLDFLKTVPDESLKLVVTSHPYNIGKVYEERVKLEEYLEYQRKAAKECKRILTDNGNIAWKVGNNV